MLCFMHSGHPFDHHTTWHWMLTLPVASSIHLNIVSKSRRCQKSPADLQLPLPLGQALGRSLRRACVPRPQQAMRPHARAGEAANVLSCTLRARASRCSLLRCSAMRWVQGPWPTDNAGAKAPLRTASLNQGMPLWHQ